MISIEVVLRYKSIRAAELWRMLTGLQPALKSREVIESRQELTKMGAELEQLLEATDASEFRVRFDNTELTGPYDIANNTLALVTLKNACQDMNEANLWLSAMLVDERFVQARVYDYFFDKWQNATDPLEFEGSGINHLKLPLTSNGLPFPLTQTIVDISRNPGRKTLRVGYIESVGAKMWLTERFLERTGASIEGLSKIASVVLVNGVYEVSAQAEPFTSATGAEARLQDALRAELYPYLSRSDEPASHGMERK
jgi:hypothetical protein